MSAPRIFVFNLLKREGGGYLGDVGALKQVPLGPDDLGGVDCGGGAWDGSLRYAPGDRLAGQVGDVDGEGADDLREHRAVGIDGGPAVEVSQVLAVDGVPPVETAPLFDRRQRSPSGELSSGFCGRTSPAAEAEELDKDSKAHPVVEHLGHYL